MTDETRIPIIRLRGNLVVTIQVALSDRLVTQLMDDVTRNIDQTGARGLVIDVSGIDVMDSYISRTIRDIGLVARLMGVTAVICGLDPTIAMTLVEMDMDIKGVHTELNLESALTLLERKQGEEDRAVSRGVWSEYAGEGGGSAGGASELHERDGGEGDDGVGGGPAGPATLLAHAGRRPASRAGTRARR